MLDLDLVDVGLSLAAVEMHAADVVAVSRQGERRRLAEAAAGTKDERPSLARIGRGWHRRSLLGAFAYHRSMAEQLTLLTVHAHPDDETISTGGIMARYAAEGVRVVCVTCTGGEYGEIVVPELDTPENHARLAEIRREELSRALAHLGPIESRMLGFVDSGMMGTPENDLPGSFWTADFDEAVERLVAIVREVRPQVDRRLQRLRRLRPSRPHPCRADRQGRLRALRGRPGRAAEAVRDGVVEQAPRRGHATGRGARRQVVVGAGRERNGRANGASARSTWPRWRPRRDRSRR